MVRINWTVRALSDLQEIYDYIAKDSKFYARATSKKLRNRVKILKRQVYAGGIIPEEDRHILKEMGVAQIFGPGTATKEIASFIRKTCKK